MNAARSKEWVRPVVLSVAGIGGLALFIAGWNHITGTRVVAHATLPNGVEIMVRQSFTWDGDLFNTSFHYRRPNGRWVWRYYSHEDNYWGKGLVELDEASRVATVHRGRRPAIEFNWETLAHTQFTETQDGMPKLFTVATDQ